MFLVSLAVEHPRSPLTQLTPYFSLAIGLAILFVIGSCTIVLILRCVCGRNKRKEFVRTHGTTVRAASPGPSDKSATSKEIDGNESDEKNPDVIPDTIESDEQVTEITCLIIYHLACILLLCNPVSGNPI